MNDCINNRAAVVEHVSNRSHAIRHQARGRAARARNRRQQFQDILSAQVPLLQVLKELELTEGRGTGIPKIFEAMNANGSPSPRFETDEGRTYFLAEIPIHPAFATQAHDEAHDELNEMERNILRICKDEPKSNPEILKALGYRTLVGNVKKALQRLTELGLIELTIPDKPRSKKQKRRITSSGRRAIGLKI